MASHLAPNHFLFPCSNINNVSYNPRNNRISHHNYPNQQKPPNPPKSTAQPKWKPASQTPRSLVSDIPRKWCNFVLRRNPENILYRSESFRFIQKTSSLEPLIPARNGFRNKLKLALVPVSADYVEPLDQVDFGTHHSDVSSARGQVGLRKPEHEYNEIPENYNAPYYYSDTLKGLSTEEQPKKACPDDTYCSPCHTLKTLPATPQFVSSSSASVRSLRPTTTSSSTPQQRDTPASQNSVPSPASAQSTSSASPMARKRYETAFLPTSSLPSQCPDADLLLLSIESASLGLPAENVAMSDRNESRASRPTSSDNYNILRRREPSISLYSGSDERIRMGPSRGPVTISSTQTHVHSHAHSSHNSPLLGLSDTQSSTSSPARTIPHSEPLPQKRYIKLNSAFSTQSSSGCSTTSSCSPSQGSSCQRRTGVGKKSLLQMKDNSVSSLESIDSAKSDDVKYTQRFHVRGVQGGNLKLLSPISDKSPLEPPVSLQALPVPDLEEDCGRDSVDSANYEWTKRNLLNAAEQLTNVPWEMPKLRRRLALLADSGISIDYPPSRERDMRKDFDEITISHNIPKSRELDTKSASPHFFYGKERKSLSSTSGAYSSHIRSNFQLKLPKENAYYDVSSGDGVRMGSQLDAEEYDVDEEDYEPQEPVPRGKGLTSRAQFYSSQYCGGEDRYELPIRRNTAATLTSMAAESLKPDRCKMKLNFGDGSALANPYMDDINPEVELETQDWFHGAITRSEAESILRATKEGSFMVRNCESSTFNRFSLSLKSSKGFIHIRIEPNSLGTFSLGEQEFPSVPHLVLYFMTHRLPIKGAEHVKLKYPVITQLL